MDRSKWEYKKLGELGEIITGGTPPTKDPRNYSSDDYCFVKPSDLTDEKVMMLDDSEFHVSSYAYSNSRKLPKGSVLVCCIGSIGKLGILNVDATCNQQINAIIPKEGFDSKYLAYTLLASKHNLLNIANAPVVPIINKSQFSNIKIKVCPPQDQERIVAELDCLNEMIALKQEQLKEFDKLAQSIFYDMFGDPITNEKGWSIVSWNEALQILNGRNQKMVETSDGKYPICGSAGVMGRANDYICPEDTVIIGRKGNINKPILMREKFWNVDTAFGLVPNREKLDSVYLFYFCDEYDFEKHNRAVTIPSLTKSDLLRITFPLPPLALQQQFAEKIQAIEEQKELVKKSIAETQQLLDSRMDFYFD